MTESGLPYKSISPSNAPPSIHFYRKKQGIFGDNLAENDSNYFVHKDSSVNNSVNSQDFELKGCKFIHNRNNINVVHRTHDSSNTLNVVDSNSNSELPKVDKFTKIVNCYKDSNQYVNNFHLLRSKFEPNNTKVNNNRTNFISNNDKYTTANEKLKESLKLSRENLNVVREFKKDVPSSRLPIMYQDDVEALLSRKPNSVRNFVNSLNKQLNSISNKTGDYKFKLGSYENKFTNLNQTNYCKSSNQKNENRDNKFDLKLEDLNLKLESLGRDGLFGHFDEFRDFVNFEKYISKNHKFNLNGHNKLFDSSFNNLDKVQQEDKDNMLTYRSNSFGNFSLMSPVADCTKSTSDPCNNSSRDGFLVNKNNSNFSVNNQYTNNNFNINNFKTNFDNYFNNNNGNFLINETFKRSKLSSRSNMTRMNTDRSVRNDFNTTNRVYYNGDSVENSVNVTSQPNGFDNEDRNSMSQRRTSLGDLIFNKRLMQSINTLPEGVNLVIDTPRSEKLTTQHGFLRTVKRFKNDENIFINSVNLIKAGWVWVQSSKTREWVPKFMVLFYDDEVSPKNFYTQLIPNYPNYNNSNNNYRIEYPSNFMNGGNKNNNSNNGNGLDRNSSNNDNCTYNIQFGNRNGQPKDYNRYFQGDIVKSNDGFWGIYQVYTQLNPNLHPAISNSKFNSPHSSNRSDSTNMKYKYDENLIRDNSLVYLCLLNHEPPDYYDCITNRNYLQLYKVDTTTTPYLRSFNSCWLTRFIARRMKTNLELIIIPLEDNYECCFAPLCAAKLNSEVNFSYEMELAFKEKVNHEYDQWMFKLWEYSLRSTNQLNTSSLSMSTDLIRLDGAIIPNVNNHSDNSSEQISGDELALSNNTGFFTKCYKYLCSLFGMSTDEDITNDTVVDKSKLRTRIIESINNTRDQQSPTNRSSSDDGLSKDDQVECENIPSPQNFINWIDKYGFDDLSIKMNMYTLVNRV